MKLVTFYQVQRARIGILDDEKNEVFPISEILESDTEMTMLDLIEHWGDELKEKLSKYNDYEGISTNDVKISAPIPHPNRVICVGKNYLDHVKEVDTTIVNTKSGVPDNPIFFSKLVNRAVGPNEIIKAHEKVTEQLDYEAEFALIIGKEGANIKKEDAHEYIFGYTILNDISARNVQTKHTQWLRGKSLDDNCPIGPAIITVDEVAFPPALKIQSKVNSELRQNSTTDMMIWPIAELLEILSDGLTLKKGDIIATGTPSGVGMGMNPKTFLKKGDIVECYIENIGSLINTIE